MMRTKMRTMDEGEDEDDEGVWVRMRGVIEVIL